MAGDLKHQAAKAILTEHEAPLEPADSDGLSPRVLDLYQQMRAVSRSGK